MIRDDQILTPEELGYLIGETVVLHEFKKNKRLKSVKEEINPVIITNVIKIQGSSNKIVELRLIGYGQSNEYRSIVFDEQGNSVKSGDSLRIKYVITK